MKVILVASMLFTGAVASADGPALPDRSAREVAMAASTDILGVRQIAITVRDLDRARTFYRDVLGIPFLFDAPPQMAFFEVGGIRLLLGVAEKPEQEHHSSILYFRTESIEAVHERLAAAGVTFVEAPRMVAEMSDHQLWLALFRDTEGNTMALLEERR
ncbi:MAG TPA: VOC family protein [Thermoanaerobaculia bacterium]|nr:VOC family protein [Thermoanaerobaculia bacterium]